MCKPGSSPHRAQRPTRHSPTSAATKAGAWHRGGGCGTWLALATLAYAAWQPAGSGPCGWRARRCPAWQASALSPPAPGAARWPGTASPLRRPYCRRKPRASEPAGAARQLNNRWLQQLAAQPPACRPAKVPKGRVEGGGWEVGGSALLVAMPWIPPNAALHAFGCPIPSRKLCGRVLQNPPAAPPAGPTIPRLPPPPSPAPFHEEQAASI